MGDRADIAELSGYFSELPCTYIADGHHRAASAVKVALKRRAMAAETQAAKLSELDNEYATKLEDNKNSIIVAATVDQDEEYADQLRQERQALQNEYIQKRSEL